MEKGVRIIMDRRKAILERAIREFVVGEEIALYRRKISDKIYYYYYYYHHHNHHYILYAGYLYIYS
jgi:hypothetical protein